MTRSFRKWILRSSSVRQTFRKSLLPGSLLKRSSPRRSKNGFLVHFCSFFAGAASSTIPSDKPRRPEVIQHRSLTRLCTLFFISDALAAKQLVRESEGGGRLDAARRPLLSLRDKAVWGGNCIESSLCSKRGPDLERKKFYTPSPSDSQVQLHFDMDKGQGKPSWRLPRLSFASCSKLNIGRANSVQGKMRVGSTWSPNCRHFCVSAFR